MIHFDVAVIGGGIVGLAATYILAKKGYKVALIEKNEQAIGASVRNFGLVWPIGQKPGPIFERALKSREVWLELKKEANIWANEVGSLHLAYTKEELQVLDEFVSTYDLNDYKVKLLTNRETLELQPNIKSENLQGALWSPLEVTVNPRQAIEVIPNFLKEKYGVTLFFGDAATSIDGSLIQCGKKTIHADKINICSGADFETLFPDLYHTLPIHKCKLQMMKFKTKDTKWTLGPSLCAGLTLRHYKAFEGLPSLSLVDRYYDEQNLLYKENGIHVLVSQNNDLDLIIGDSHHYSLNPTPFDYEYINDLIIEYLKSFINIPQYKITERWHGVYAKLSNGGTEVVLDVNDKVKIINGLGGAGMTLSFGLMHEIFA